MVGHVQLQDVSETTEESFVDVLNEVGGENDDTWKPFYVVQQHTHIHVGIAISGRPGSSNIYNSHIRCLKMKILFGEGFKKI